MEIDQETILNVARWYVTLIVLCKLKTTVIFLVFFLKKITTLIWIFISEYFVSRLDTINIDSSNDISTFKFEEFKIFTLNNTGDYYTCIRTEDILNYKVFIKNFHLEMDKKSDTVEYNISLWENNIFFWSTNFHMKALLLFK